MLHKKQGTGTLSRDELGEVVDAIEALPIRYFSHRGSLKQVCTLAFELGLTAYDAAVLHLARVQGAQLITADAVLSSAARRLRL